MARGKVENPINWAYSWLVIAVCGCSCTERFIFYVESKALGNLAAARGETGLRWGIAASHAKWSSLCQVRSNVTRAPPWDWPFHMWALAGWKDNERRETESSDGDMKSPLAQMGGGRKKRFVQIFLLYLLYPSFILSSSSFTLPAFSTGKSVGSSCLTSVALRTDGRGLGLTF